MLRIFNYLKQNHPESLAPAMTQEDLDLLKQNFIKHQLPLPESDDFWIEYFIHDGLAFNGCLLFSVKMDALWEHGFSLPDLLTENIQYHSKYHLFEQYNPRMIFIGRNDEEVIVYNSKTELFSLLAREDLMPYFESKDRAEIISRGMYMNIEKLQ